MGDFVGGLFEGIPIIGDVFAGAEQSAREDDIYSRSTDLQDLAAGLSRQANTAGLNWLTDTQAMRDAFIGRMTDILGGNFDPAASPAFGPLKSATENIYGTGAKKVMENTPSGGSLTAALTNLEGNKAQTLTDAIAKIITGELGQAYQTAGSSLAPYYQGVAMSAAPLGAWAGSGSSLLNWLNGNGVGSVSGAVDPLMRNMNSQSGFNTMANSGSNMFSSIFSK